MQHPSRHKAPLLQGLSSKLHPATPGRPCAFPPPPFAAPRPGPQVFVHFQEPADAAAAIHAISGRLVSPARCSCVYEHARRPRACRLQSVGRGVAPCAVTPRLTVASALIGMWGSRP